MSRKILIVFLALAVGIAIFFVYADVAEAQELVADGLVSYWSFDRIEGGKVEDAVGGNDGNLVGNVVEAEGKFGKGLEFDGSDARVEVPDPAAFDFNADFTWCAWIKTDVGGVIVAETQGEDDQGPKTFFVRDGMLAFDTGWVGATEGTAAVNDGQWHYVAVTVEFNGEDAIEFYVDGEPDAQGQMDVDSFPEAEFPLWIGFDGRADPGEFPGFTGVIDEVSVYDRSLSPEEIQQNFASEGLGLAPVSPAEKLVSTWGDIKASR